MARSLFKLPGFITKERINSSTKERTGSGFSAFKASADRSAQKNATSDVISTKLVTLFTDQARS